jgi:nucleoside-diphosphate-sugar epimerase
MIVATGASGFIGWALTEELLRRGYRVLAVSKSGRAPEGAEAPSHDLRKQLSLPGNVEAVVHLAAQASVTRSFQEEWETFESNVLPVINMARLALEKNAPLILASSAEVYGVTGDPSIMHKEDEPLANRPPLSPYALAKIIAELVVRHYVLRGLRAVVMRPTSTYGRLLFNRSERARDYFVEKAVSAMLSGAPELAFDGYGESARQWLYYPDHVSAYIIALEKAEPQPLEVYNVSGPGAVTLRAVISILQQLTGWSGQVRWGLRPRPVDPNYLLVDSSRLRSLGWSPKYDILLGLSDYLDKIKLRIVK